MTYTPARLDDDGLGPVHPAYGRPLLADRAARTGRHAEPWTAAADRRAANIADLMGLEATATHLRQYSPILIPGLLQSPAYARAIIEATTPERLSTGEVESRARARVFRASRFLEGVNREEPCRAEWVIGEAALLSPYGGTEVLLGQLSHLLALCDRRDLDIRVLPLGAPGTAVQAFSIYRQGPDRPIVYREQVGGSAYSVDMAAIADHSYAFDRAQAGALDPAASRALIVQRWEDMWTSHGGGRAATPDTKTASRSPASDESSSG